MGVAFRGHTGGNMIDARSIRALLMTAISVAAIVFWFSGRVIYVDINADGNGDGSSWEHAYTDLQAALEASHPGDEIRVADGVYKPSRRLDPADPRSATFQLPDSVKLSGGYAGCDNPEAPRSPRTYRTVLSGDLQSDDNLTGNKDNCYHVLTASDPTNPWESHTLDGITIIAGNADNMSARGNDVGGGIYQDNSLLTLIDCTIKGNRAVSLGSGLFCRDGMLTLTRCEFVENSASTRDKNKGVYHENSRLTVTNCRFNSTPDILTLKK